uniref:Kelch domain-containing protein 10 n=1 Tax=Ciona savignyi TaxID=51511 RepID=H2Z7M1_CIOSA
MQKFSVNQFVKVERKDQKEAWPLSRSGHRSVAGENNFWVFGGYNPEIISDDLQSEDNLLRELWSFNVTTNTWKLIPPDRNMPDKVASHAVFRHGDQMLVFGGTGFPFGASSSNDLYVCHLPSGQWKVIECKGSIPESVYGQAITVIDSDLYTYGGTTGLVYNTDLHKLDLHNFTWKKIKPNNSIDELPPERYRHEIAVYAGKIFVLGGGTSHRVYRMTHVHVYCTRSNKWSAELTKWDKITKKFPWSRRCHSCVQHHDKAFICGGYDGVAVHTDLWQLHLPHLQWSKIAVLPEPLYFHSAAITTEGCMLVFGGTTEIRSMKRTDSCYRIWLAVPSLQTLCWHTLIETRPHLLSMTKQQLLTLGISEHFIKKLPCADGA